MLGKQYIVVDKTGDLTKLSRIVNDSLSNNLITKGGSLCSVLDTFSSKIESLIYTVGNLPGITAPAQSPITLTTIGTSGAATLVNNILNIPQYTPPSVFTGTALQYIKGDGSYGLISSLGGGAANTDALVEGTTNLYFTQPRVLSTTLTGFNPAPATVTAADTIITAMNKLYGIATNNTSNIATLTSQVTSNTNSIPLKQATLVSGTNIKTINGITLLGSGDITVGGSITTVFGRTGAITATSGDYNTSQVTENTNLYFTTARAQSAISLTTTGTSGAASYTGGVLNIPNYGSGAGLSGMTAGRVEFAATSSTLGDDSALVWDNTGKQLMTPVLAGGSTAAGVLTLTSTTNASKNVIWLGSAHTSWFDEVNSTLVLASGGHFKTSFSPGNLDIYVASNGNPTLLGNGGTSTIGFQFIGYAADNGSLGCIDFYSAKPGDAVHGTSAIAHNFRGPDSSYIVIFGGGNVGVGVGANDGSSKLNVGGNLKAMRYVDTMQTPIAASSTTVVDLSQGQVIPINMGANITTLTLNNGLVATYTLKLLQDVTGGRTITWPASVHWPSGTAPTLSGASKVDIITLKYDGTIYYGSYQLNYS